MHTILLGGWRHVADDVGRLNQALRAVPDTCACGQGAAHLAGTCACCQAAEHAFHDGCSDCQALLEAVCAEIDELADATLRFLPVVESLSAADPGRAGGVRELRRAVTELAADFEELETAAGEFRRGCAVSHLARIKRIVGELAGRTREVGVQLGAAPVTHAPPLSWPSRTSL